MNALTLYQLADEYIQLLDLAADPEADLESFAAALEGLKGDLMQKGVAVAQAALNLESAAQQVNEAAKKMAARAVRLEKRAAHIRGYLAEQMEKTGIQKIDSPYFSIALRENNPRVIVDDDVVLGPEFLRRIPELWEPNKIAIRSALERGESVPGCHLERSKRVDLR